MSPARCVTVHRVRDSAKVADGGLPAMVGREVPGRPGIRIATDVDDSDRRTDPVVADPDA